MTPTFLALSLLRHLPHMSVATLWANVVNIVMGIVLIYRSTEVVGIAWTALVLFYFAFTERHSIHPVHRELSYRPGDNWDQWIA